MNINYLRIIFALTLALFVLGCNTKDIKLITTIDYTLVTSHEDIGFVKDSLATEIVLTPEAKHPDFFYFIKYEVVEGSGHFLAADDTLLPEGEDVLLDLELEYTTNWRYVGTSSGTHQVKIVAEDNYERKKEETLIYTIKDVEILWEATSAIAMAKVNDTIPINLELQNRSVDQEVTFERIIRITKGSGKVLDSDKKEFTLNELETITTGITELFFVSNTVAPATVTFDLIDSNGQEKATSVSFDIIGEDDNLPPLAVAAILDNGVDKGPAPFKVIFDGSGSTDNDGSITAYSWDFGDGTAPGTGVAAIHTFETPGEYIVTLTVTDDKDAINSNTNTNTVVILVQETIPIADANFEQYLVDEGFDTDGIVNGLMYKDDAEAVTVIKAGGPPFLGITYPVIETLSGIEFFINLESIQMDTNGLKTLNVSNNLKLKKLVVTYQSQLSSLDLTKNINLEEVVIDVISSLDTSLIFDLSKNTKLKEVTIRNLTISSINLSNGNNAGITSLRIERGICIEVDDVAFARNNTNWTIQNPSYYTTDCSIPRETINIPDTNFEQALIDLDYDIGTPDGKVFKDEVERIKELDLSTIDVVNFTGIEFFIGLEKLVIFDLRETIDFSKYSKLTDLDITQYTGKIDVSGNRALTNLRLVDGGATSSIDFSNNIVLRTVELVNNAINAITLPPNAVIDNLKLNNNSLRALDLSVVKTLTTMDIVGNFSLTCIKVNDVAAANANTNWTKDATATYNTTCP